MALNFYNLLEKYAATVKLKLAESCIKKLFLFIDIIEEKPNYLLISFEAILQFS